jgi:hypothetical protein
MTDHDWAAIRKAFEAGEPWSSLKLMGPHKSTIARRAVKENWDGSKRHLSVVRDMSQETETPVAERKPGQPWSLEDKAVALLVYLDVGSSILTSKATGIPDSTIRLWAREDPTWADACCQATRAIKSLVESEVRAIIKRMLTIMLDDGDPAMINAANNTLKVMTHTASLLAGEPTDRYEHATPEQIREAAGRHFGYDLGRTAEDPVPVPEDVRN